MREIRQSGSEGGEGDKRPSLPLSTAVSLFLLTAHRSLISLSDKAEEKGFSEGLNRLVLAGR
jgi:hypothetical protein